MNDEINIERWTKELSRFIKWVDNEVDKTDSEYKLKGYMLAGEVIKNKASKRYDDIIMRRYGE